jgi:hypothetical protein
MTGSKRMTGHVPLFVLLRLESADATAAVRSGLGHGIQAGGDAEVQRCRRAGPWRQADQELIGGRLVSVELRRPFATWSRRGRIAGGGPC